MDVILVSLLVDFEQYFPIGDFDLTLADIYLFNVNNGNTRATSQIYLKLTTKKPKRYHWRRFGAFIVNFEQNVHIVLVFPLLTLNK